MLDARTEEWPGFQSEAVVLGDQRKVNIASRSGRLAEPAPRREWGPWKRNDISGP